MRPKSRKESTAPRCCIQCPHSLSKASWIDLLIGFNGHKRARYGRNDAPGNGRCYHNVSQSKVLQVIVVIVVIRITPRVKLSSYGVIHCKVDGLDDTNREERSLNARVQRQQRSFLCNTTSTTTAPDQTTASHLYQHLDAVEWMPDQNSRNAGNVTSCDGVADRSEREGGLGGNSGWYSQGRPLRHYCFIFLHL